RNRRNETGGRAPVLGFLRPYPFFGCALPSLTFRKSLIEALVYHGPRKVSVDTVPDAKLEKMTDVVIDLTTTNICGSDLHMYEGRTDVEKGKILGHENLGVVIEVGTAA